VRWVTGCCGSIRSSSGGISSVRSLSGGSASGAVRHPTGAVSAARHGHAARAGTPTRDRRAALTRARRNPAPPYSSVDGSPGAPDRRHRRDEGRVRVSSMTSPAGRPAGCGNRPARRRASWSLPDAGPVGSRRLQEARWPRKEATRGPASRTEESSAAERAPPCPRPDCWRSPPVRAVTASRRWTRRLRPHPGGAPPRRRPGRPSRGPPV
jgi:hypothetical protein